MFSLTIASIRHHDSSVLACPSPALYTRMEECTSTQELSRLLLDQDKLKGELDQWALDLLRADSTVFRPVTDEVSRLSVSTTDSHSSPVELGDQFPSFENLY